MLKKLLIVLVVLSIVIGVGYKVFVIDKTSQPNVVFILIDTLRPDHMSMNGYERETSPFLDSFARENLNFKYAFAAAPWTPVSIASILTGLYPSAHGMMPPNNRLAAAKTTRLSSHLETMPEIFKEGGYETAAVITNPWLQKNFGYNQGYEYYHYIDRVKADKVNEKGLKVVDALLKKESPFFLYLHYMDVHNPYEPPEEYRNIFPETIKHAALNEDMRRLVDLYDGEIKYIDDRLKELFDAFKQRGIYDDLIIVVVSDHGEQFMERGHHGHGFNLYNEELHVLFTIKAPGHKGEVAVPVSLVDILPTLLELTGFSVPDVVQGYSLISSLAGRQRAGMLAEIKRRYNQKAVVWPDGRKLILDYDIEDDWLLNEGQGENNAQLFDAINDYLERNPLDDSKLLDTVKAGFQLLYQKIKSGAAAEPDEVDIDPATMKELGTLGYL